jgi:hypothetical protein
MSSCMLHPIMSARPTGYMPGKKAADPTPYLQESVQGRPLPHSASGYTLHGRSTDFCILTLCAFPDMFHPALVTPPPCSRVPIYCAHGFQTVCPNPHATAVMMGHRVREPLPTVCTIHRSLPPAERLQPHEAMLQQLKHFDCHFASPHYRLEAPEDSPS